MQDLIKIEVNSQASNRTIKIVREKGPIFYVLSVSAHVWQFPGVECALIQTLDENWMGWLPINEIKTEEVFEVV